MKRTIDSASHFPYHPFTGHMEPSEFEYRRYDTYFAQTARGLEEEAARELTGLGAQRLQVGYCGVRFSAPPAVLYRINYCARLLSHVIAPLLTFDCHSDRYLYQTAGKIPWETLFSTAHTFAVSAHVSDSRITHSHYAALRLKDAVVDRFRTQSGERPDIDTEHPDIRLSLFIHRNRAVIGVDTSGESLHRRGYRRESVAAPLQETVAAAILQISGWDGSRPLYDPFCGSGTLLAETWLTACRIPAAYQRKRFGFERLPDFEPAVWQAVRAECDAAVHLAPAGLVAGSDIDPVAVRAARINLDTLPGGAAIRCTRGDFRHLPDLPEHTIVCNPPYGERLGRPEELKSLYKEFGDFLKRHCRGSTAWILGGNRELLKHLGLKPGSRTPLPNGPLDCRLVRIDVF